MPGRKSRGAAEAFAVVLWRLKRTDCNITIAERSLPAALWPHTHSHVQMHILERLHLHTHARTHPQFEVVDCNFYTEQLQACVFVHVCPPGGWDHWQVFALCWQMQLDRATAVHVCVSMCVCVCVVLHLDAAGVCGSNSS